MPIYIVPRGKNAIQQFQRTEVANTTAGAATAFVRTDGLLRQNGTNQGLRFINNAASIAAIQVSVSSDPPELASNPAAAIQAGITWKVLGSPVAGATLVDTDGLSPSTVRLVFSAVGSMVITAN